MKKMFIFIFVFGTTQIGAQWDPPVDYAPAVDECLIRFGTNKSQRNACLNSVNVCQNWFGLSGQPYQYCQNVVLWLHGIRESNYTL
jgi:hypothetical protein